MTAVLIRQRLAHYKKNAPVLVQISSNELKWFSLTAKEFAQAFYQAVEGVTVPVVPSQLTLLPISSPMARTGR